MTDGVAKPELKRGAIGLREVTFQSITAMAPGAAVAASIPAGAAFAGGDLPLSVLIALIASLLTAVSIGELASRIPSAGSLAAYGAKAIHPIVGFFIGWGYIFVYALVPALVFLQLGFTVAGTLSTEIHGYPASLWWPWSLAGMGVVFIINYRGITTSAKTGTILGAIEIAVFGVLAVLFIAKAGGHNTLSVFGTSYTPKAFHGVTGVIAGSVYSLLAFAGFEAAAPLAEEAKSPKVTIRKGILAATVGIGIFYVFTTYAVTVIYGPGKFANFNSASSWQGLAQSMFGLFWILVFFAIINSTLANGNAGTNVSTRMSYALARVGVFPGALAKITPRFQTPKNANIIQLIVSVAAVLVLGLSYNPVNGFALDGTIITIVVVAAYILMNVSAIVYFLRHEKRNFKFFTHLFVPALGVLVLIPALFAGAGVPVFSFISPLPAPISYAGPVVGVWLVLGAVFYTFKRKTAPESLIAISEVFGEEGGEVHLSQKTAP
ncbi:Amino acid permease [Ferrithrix thermotolerans DSM 19514]|uniref:Amino acid permease n=1 Tax=Ferrithrix thermotolerans DSM 19514 TaxID=1121881 RepID=A0A1M4U6M4_9ACTN|nr:Amino acid permease [Ferrithrix thermotolerans DSM 19514]